MTLTIDQLEQLLVTQGNELAAQRRTIERLQAKVRAAERADEEIARASELAREAYRRGYRMGWSSGRRGDTCVDDPERRARGALRELMA